MTISSYNKIYNIGHYALINGPQNLLDGQVIIQEKCDGSQWSMLMKNGELCCRSKGQQLILDAPQKMFEPAV